MDKKGKQESVKHLNTKFAGSKCAVLADYRGLTVSEVTDLRQSLRNASSEFKVAKNTLAKIAIKGTHAEPLGEHFSGPKAIVFSYGDPVAGAKILKEFAKKQPKLEVKVGVLEGKLLSVKDIDSLAELPSREVLLARFLGALKSPQSGLVNVLSGVPRKLLYALEAIKKTKE